MSTVIKAKKTIYISANGTEVYADDDGNHLFCLCGETVDLIDFTNTCEKCNRDYNAGGQLLAPRSQWGQDTNESPAEVASILFYNPRSMEDET